MAGNHSEILSVGPECWPGAAVQSLNNCETHQPSLDWQHVPVPTARNPGSSFPTVPVFIAVCFLGKVAQRSNSQQVSVPEAHQICQLDPRAEPPRMGTSSAAGSASQPSSAQRFLHALRLG